MCVCVCVCVCVFFACKIQHGLLICLLFLQTFIAEVEASEEIVKRIENREKVINDFENKNKQTKNIYVYMYIINHLLSTF